MALQYSVTLRNAQLDALETTVGASPKLQIRTGAQPSNCAAADTGSLILEIALPADWMAAAASGLKAMLGTWTGTATLAGTNQPGHFRIKNNAGSTTHVQGSCTAVGGGGNMEVDSASIVQGQAVNVVSFQLGAGNA